ncbi:hypothetical protein JAAARDRAFT_200814 [Jaapia argillacea MUCL 33604]|uniref:BTB domain-containing protein n=1 Tax=Jaapia argillacea MUCL 33604 TaxID=933084 RepID=A0A067P3J6_9AGAM|nr:hypothetical protein JAAARDRAFT_200814 [Jaapia argillacea MUCL 33604]
MVSISESPPFAGCFKIQGLRQACIAKEDMVIESPDFGNGRWFVFPRFLPLTSHHEHLRDRSITLEICREESPNHIGAYCMLCDLSEDSFTSRRPWNGVVYCSFVLKCRGKILETQRFQFEEVELGKGWGSPNFCPVDFLASYADLEDEDVVELEYLVEEYSNESMSVHLTPSLLAMSRANEQIFDDRSSCDVKFVIVHPHASTLKPRYIYAHSKFLASHDSGYFKTLFQGHFAESASEEDEKACAIHPPWGGFSDSDYDDDDEPEEDTAEEEAGVVDSRVVDEPNASSQAGGPIEITMKDPDDETSVTLCSKPGQRSHHAESSKNSEPIPEVPQAPGPSSFKTVYITDASYRTYRALLFYLYTGCIAFAPPKSTYEAKRAASPDEFMSRDVFNVKNAAVLSTLGHRSIPWVSSKSLYKLCDKLDLIDLKLACFAHIKASLTPENIMVELNSSFTALHTEIHKMQSEYLESHWEEVRKSKSFNKLFQGLLKDHSPSLADTLVDLFQRLSLK